MPYAEVGTGKIWYVDHRQADETRAPLIVIHGAAGTHLDFPISLRKLHTLAPDLPGHGRSDPPAFNRVEDYAASMRDFLDLLNIPEIYLMGHSMGGAIAQLLALTMPERVRGLILLTTGAYLPVSPTLIQGLGEKIVETLNLIVKWEWAKDVPQAWRDQSLKNLMQTPPPVILGDYYACLHFDVRPRLSSLTLPTLILGGTLDRMTPPALQEDLLVHIPHATLRMIPGGGHMVALEQSDLVTSLVNEWLIQQGRTQS